MSILTVVLQQHLVVFGKCVSSFLVVVLTNPEVCWEDKNNDVASCIYMYLY